MNSLVDFTDIIRVPFAVGQSFGEAGAYEQLTCKVRFKIDPKDSRSRGIVDLDLAPAA